MAATTTPGRTGRPPKIDRVIDTDDNGDPVTTAQKIINRVRNTWAPWENIAPSVGVDGLTIRLWRKKGAAALAKLANGEPVTRNERLYADFLTGIERAEAEAFAMTLGVITKEAAGGYTTTKTVRTVRNSRVIQEITTVETVRPTWTAAAWLLQHRGSAEFRKRLELTGADGAPIQIDVSDERAIAETVKAYLQGTADAATTPEPEDAPATMG